MRKYPALPLFTIASVFLFFILVLPKQSFAQTRLYQCSPAFDYASSPANCYSGPRVSCIDPYSNPPGKTIQVDNGKICADNAAIYYSGKELKTITAQCIDKCTDIPLTKICSPDANNTCPATNFTCQGKEGQRVVGAASKTFCIQYTEVVPTPTPTPTPTPCPGCPTPTPSCGFIAQRELCIGTGWVPIATNVCTAA